MVFEWEQNKNQKLIKERGVSFEAVVSRIEEGEIFAITPGKGKYGHQKQFIIVLDGYVYIVPFVEGKGKVFLKTIIPSRKMTQRYLSGGKSDEKL